MKQLAFVSSNLNMAALGDGLVPLAEIILVVTEPCYSPSPEGIETGQKTGEVRFFATPESLRALAKTCLGIADLGDSLASRTTLAPKEPEE